MSTKFVSQSTDGVKLLGASNGDSEYILWQADEREPGVIHFEAEDQHKSGDDIVTECTLDLDGCHIVLSSGDLVHFYWNPPRHPGLADFVTGLRCMYRNNPAVLEILDY